MGQDNRIQPEPDRPAVAAGVPVLTQAARTFLVVALSGTSLVLGAAQLTLRGGPEAFLTGNQLELPTRLSVVGFAWISGLVLGALTLLLIGIRPGPSLVHTAISKLVAPFAVGAMVPILFTRGAWKDREIAYLALLLGVGLSLEWLLRMAFGVLQEWHLAWPRLSWRVPRKLTWWLSFAITLALVGFYIARIGYLTNVSHMKLHTMSSDLAEYDNLFFNALHGHPFRSPAIAGHLDDWNTLQGHAEFGLYLLLPFYALSPGAHTLLWIQSALVGLTAVPIYLLGAARLGQAAGVTFAIAYLLMPAVQQPNFYDFHFSPLSMFFVAWFLYFVFQLSRAPRSRRARIAAYAALVLALACREDISIGIAVVGVFLVLSGTLVRDGIVMATLAGLYFVVMKFGVMPLFGRWWFDAMYDDLKSPGAKGFGAVLLTMISNPVYTLRTLLVEPKLLYVLHMTVPVLALWLRRPLLWLALLPGFVSTLLATNRPPLYESSFQYTYLWVPYVVAASILAVRSGARARATLVALLFVSVSAANQLGVFPWGERIKGGFGIKTFEVSDAEIDQINDLRDIIAIIPPDASVSASEAEGPHVSKRLVMYSLKYTLGKNPDYLLVGRHLRGSEMDHVRLALESGKYGVVAKRGPFVLAKRGASQQDNGVLWQRVGGRRRR